MIIQFKSISKVLFIYWVIAQVVFVSCSKQIHGDPTINSADPLAGKKRMNSFIEADKHKPKELSFQNIATSAEKNKLNEFLAADIEKPLDSYNLNASDIIKTARTYLGVPHCMGGRSRKCIDCSGLLVEVFGQFDIHLPHNSEEQAKFGKILSSREELEKGDLVFFMRTYRTHKIITHSGIYIGGNEFIHTSSKSGVTISSLSDSYWNAKFLFGTRVLKP